MKLIRKKISSLAYDHIWLKYVLDYGFSLLATVVSAAIFAFGMVVFLEPAPLSSATNSIPAMVSGGSSGAAQVIKSIINSISRIDPKHERLILSLLYITINAPLLFLAFKGVGKRFAIFTLINVASVALFTNIFKGEFFEKVAVYVNNNGALLTRALFAGMCTGLSSAIAYKIDTSAGGFDIVSFYISAKKGAMAGKVGMIINGVVVVSFGVVSAISTKDYASAMAGMLFSFVYLLTVMLVIDAINVRNKKAQIQITTSNKDLTKLLIANIPHGATVVEAKGGFTENERIMIYMVVSTSEIKRSVKIIRELDPQSFVIVQSLHGVYGRFHMRPIK